MGFRFRKSFKIAPGVRVNLSKRGASVSAGKPGATVNVSSKGTRATVGLPGTGISYSEKLTSAASAPADEESGSIAPWVIGIAVVAVIVLAFFAR